MHGFAIDGLRVVFAVFGRHLLSGGNLLLLILILLALTLLALAFLVGLATTARLERLEFGRERKDLFLVGRQLVPLTAASAIGEETKSERHNLVRSLDCTLVENSVLGVLHEVHEFLIGTGHVPTEEVNHKL